MRDPRRRTTDTPTFGQSRSRRRCKDVSTRDYDRVHVLRRFGSRGIAIKPLRDYVVIELLGPEHAGERRRITSRASCERCFGMTV
jgi:hypothetical protein